ncbi:MAG: hypothetical protein ACFFAO_17595 [Candidatus Hermodarchaeota archaeon]
MPNLYHYIESKRELWIAIRKRYFKELRDVLNTIIENHKGNYLDLFIELATAFLEFSEADYRRLDFIFLTPIPHLEKLGPFEKTYKPYNLLVIINDVIKRAIEAGEKKEKDDIKLTFFFYEINLGVAIVERNIVKINEDISEPTKIASRAINIKENRKFFIDQLRKFLI